MAVPSLNKSAIHALEALVTGARSPSGSILSTTVVATIPTAAVSITGVVTATVTGAALGDIVLVGQQGAVIAGVGAYGGYISAANELTLYAVATTGGYTGAEKTYNVLIFKQS